MPLATGHRVYFECASPSGETEEVVLGRVAAYLASRGFSTTPPRRGSSGIELCMTASRGTVGVALNCSLDEAGSELLMWHRPPRFWQRMLGRTPGAEEVAESLGAVCAAVREALDRDPTFSKQTWKTLAEDAAEWRARAQGARNA